MTTRSPLVSIVTPTKNRLALLRETMDSVQRQSLAEWEHIIVDDGSDDGTGAEVAGRAAADPRVRYLQRVGSNAGANVCRNIGIRESQAEYIVFLDSDDLLRPDCLQRRVGILDRNADLDFAVFRAGVFARTVGDRSRFYHDQTHGDDLLRFLGQECVWQTTGAIWRRGFLRQIGGFDETLLSMQDLELHIRAICAGAKYVFFRATDHDIRWQDDATKTSVRHFHEPAYIESAQRLIDRLFSMVKSSGLLTWSRQRALLGQCFALSENWLRAGRPDRARLTWNESCRRYAAPWHVKLYGAAMLQLLRTRPNETALIARLVNKWKGWVRFRPEPGIVGLDNDSGFPAPDLAEIEN